MGAPAARPEPFPVPSLGARLVRSSGFRLLLLTILAAWLLLAGIEALGGPEGLRGRFGAGAALVLVPVQVVVSASPVPGELIGAVQVALYGFWPGALLCWLGWVGASFLEYALARRTAREVLADDALDRMPGFLRRLPADAPAFLIFVRMLPFGAHVVNVTAAVREVPFGRFAWTACVALVPISILFSAFAAGILR